MQRPDRTAAHAPLVGFTRLRQRQFTVEMRESLDRALDRINAIETCPRDFLGRYGAAGDFSGGLRCGQRR